MASHMAGLHSELTIGEQEQFMRALAKAGITRDQIRMANNDPGAAQAITSAANGHQGYAQALRDLSYGVTMDYGREDPLDHMQSLPSCFRFPDASIRDTLAAQQLPRVGHSTTSLELVELPCSKSSFMELKEVVAYLKEKGLSPATVSDCLALPRVGGPSAQLSGLLQEIHLVGSYCHYSRKAQWWVYPLKIGIGLNKTLRLSAGDCAESRPHEVSNSTIEHTVNSLRIHYFHGQLVLGIRWIQQN